LMVMADSISVPLHILQCNTIAVDHMSSQTNEPMSLPETG